MDSKAYNAILQAVTYADVFDFPLTEKEVYRWSKNVKTLRSRDIKQANHVIYHKENYLFLEGKERLVAKRKKREVYSQQKLASGEKIARILSFIPTIKLIGVSGSVAWGNAKKNDDIDLFIICHTQTIWLTRFLSILVVMLLGRRRKPAEKRVDNTICLNMFMDERVLMYPKQNIYTAHELCQVKVLFDRDNTHARFLKANRWVKKYLPNGMLEIKDKRIKIEEKNIFSLFVNHLSLIETTAKTMQLWYMRKRLTTETVSDTLLAFHPKDYTHKILSAYGKRLDLYGQV